MRRHSSKMFTIPRPRESSAKTATVFRGNNPKVVRSSTTPTNKITPPHAKLPRKSPRRMRIPLNCAALFYLSSRSREIPPNSSVVSLCGRALLLDGSCFFGVSHASHNHKPANKLPAGSIIPAPRHCREQQAWFHTRTDNTFCANAPIAAIHPSVAAPEPRQNSLACAIRATTRPQTPTNPPKRAPGPASPSADPLVRLCLHNPSRQPLRPCKPRLGSARTRSAPNSASGATLPANTATEGIFKSRSCLSYRRKINRTAALQQSGESRRSSGVVIRCRDSCGSGDKNYGCVDREGCTDCPCRNGHACRHSSGSVVAREENLRTPCGSWCAQCYRAAGGLRAANDARRV